MIELEIECTPATASLDIRRVDRLIEALENKDKLMSDVRKHLGLRAPESNRVKLPSISDRFNHTRNVARSTEKFFTTGRHVPQGCTRDVLSEPNPFSLSREKGTDILHKVFLHSENKNQPAEACFVQKFCPNPCICRHKGAAGMKTCSLLLPGRRTQVDIVKYSHCQLDQHPNQSCPSVNPILARLAIPDTPLPPSKMEVDPDYFETLKGRPVKERFNRHDFSRIQKQVFFKKLFSGFLQDEVKRRQEHHRLDLWELENISKELDEVKQTLEAFENESHAESVKIVTEQMTISKMREEKEDELRKCKGFVNTIKSSLYKKDDILSTSMYCRDILLEMSPPKFRTKYDEEVMKHRPKSNALVDKVINLFTDFCRYNPDSEPDMFLNDVVTTFVKQLLSLGPPKIYFENKWQLDLVFRKRSLHCMEQMADLERMQTIQDEIDSVTREVKKFYTAQIDIVRQEIDAFKTNSEYQTNRSLELENEANTTLFTSFKEIVSGDIVLETLALVEVLYNYILGPSNAKFDAAEMMLQVEEELRNVEIQIQEMGEAGYRMYEKKVERKMKKEMKEALLAKDKNRETRAAILRVKNLYTKPPYGAGWRRTVQRSSPPNLRKKRAKADASVEKKHRHLQLEGICDRDDVEGEIDELLVTFIEHGGSIAHAVDRSDEEKSMTERTSLRSTVSTASLEQAIDPIFEDLHIDESSAKSLSLIQLDYDSEEELMRKNFERRKKHGEDVHEEDYGVLYDVKSIDSRFMVTDGKGQEPTGKDRRHEHRKPKKPRTNPLAWR